MIALVARAAASLELTLATFALVSALAVTLAVQVFDLRITGALGLYFVIWWTCLFAVLPFGIRSQHESGDVTAGTEPGAPVAPALREKAIWTTLLAAATLLVAAAAMPLAGL